MLGACIPVVVLIPLVLGEFEAALVMGISFLAIILGTFPCFYALLVTAQGLSDVKLHLAIVRTSSAEIQQTKRLRTHRNSILFVTLGHREKGNPTLPHTRALPMPSSSTPPSFPATK